MPNEGIGIDVAFNLDKSDLDQAFSAYVHEMSRSIGASVDVAKDLTAAFEAAVRPLSELVRSTEQLKTAFQDIKDLTRDIRENVASTRLQVPGGAPGGVGGGAGGGAVGAALGLGGLGTVGTLALGALGTAGVAGLTTMGMRAGAGALFGAGGGESGLVGRVLGQELGSQIRHSLELAGIVSPIQRGGEEAAQVQRGVSSMAPINRILRGDNPLEVMASMSGSQAAFMTGGAAGLMRGAGQGPIGLFANVVGGAVGARGGVEAMQGLGFGAAGQAIGGMIGGTMLPGMIQQYIQEGMARYPQYLATRASMAQVGLYGGDVREMRRLGAARFGYGPEEQGPAFGALFQGFGGGPLTVEAQRTAMAYSRAYGVEMGAIGQAVGGLLNIGGGGQNFGAAQRETTMVRVMADAVAEGFGRRLPEFAQSVGVGVQSVMQGPAIISQEAMPGLIETMSRLTGRIATAQGVGLQGAQRFMAPLTSAPQRFLEGFMGGGGDPYQMAMMWALNRERFGDDPMRMMEGLAAAAEDPFGEQALELHRRPLEEILRSTPDDYTALLALRQYMPDISFQGARQVVARGREILGEQGTLAGADLLEMFTGVEATQRDEADETRDTMREIQQSGEAIMREQLGAMRANAGFAESQLAVSAAMAEDARTFHRLQLDFARTSAELMRASAVGGAVRGLGELFSPEFAQQLRQAGGDPERIRRFFGRVISGLTAQGIDVSALAPPTEEEQRAAEQQAERRSLPARAGTAAGTAIAETYYGAQMGIQEQSTRLMMRFFNAYDTAQSLIRTTVGGAGGANRGR